ncbi:hypothetical protein BDW74DRAFT_187335 [Aspergillus multicolor]|uniref:uncharacterized protein n=1 Tax=Aspergillus multicolor TaxID=41759 RepID=UPI003CCD028C
MTEIKVAIAGASGETGQSIFNALLEPPDTKFEVTALCRPQSLQKPIHADLQKRGVKVVAADLHGPQEDLVKLLTGSDTPLANAAKEAGVKRFVQSALMIKKERNPHDFQKVSLPYTYIDAGWWYQIALPRLLSGRIDHVLSPAHKDLPVSLDGNVPTALADLRDVGRYVAKIIADPRTLNKRVHVYEAYTQNKFYDVIERLSGEKLERQYVSTEGPPFIAARLFYSWGIRGDDTPENAEYLGYLNRKELYQDFKYINLEDYFRDVLAGKVKGVYQG